MSLLPGEASHTLCTPSPPGGLHLPLPGLKSRDLSWGPLNCLADLLSLPATPVPPSPLATTGLHHHLCLGSPVPFQGGLETPNWGVVVPVSPHSPPEIIEPCRVLFGSQRRPHLRFTQGTTGCQQASPEEWGRLGRTE